MLLEIICTILIAVVVYFLADYILQLTELSKYPPGPLPLPLIGNLHLLGKKPHESLKRLSLKYGDVFSLSIGRQRVVVINKIEPTREALLRRGDDLAGRPQDSYPFYVLSRGYQDIAFADNSPRLKLMRKLAHGSLKMYGTGLEVLEKSIIIEIDALLERFDAKERTSVDPYHDIAMAIANIICAIIFGERYQTTDKEFMKIVEQARLIVQGISSTSAVTFMSWLRFFPSEGLSKLQRGVAMRDEILSRKLKEHKETFNSKHLRDLMDALLYEFSNEAEEDSKVKKLLTGVNLEMILADLFIAGVETTATTIQWCLAYLVIWPEVQTKIAEERIRVIGNRQPCLGDRGSLPYFEATVFETLRFSSLGLLGLPYKTTRSTTFGGQRVPQGTQVWVNQWALHYDEHEWKNPEQFKPERWLDEEGNLVIGKHKSFIPFGAGRRVCIGEALAKMELFLFLSKILFKYEIRESPDGLPSLDGSLSKPYSPKQYKVVLIHRA